MKPVDFNSLPPAYKSIGGAKDVSPGQDVLTSFGDIFKESISKVNKLQLEADDMMEKVATGEITSVHQVMVGVTKAEISLQFLLEMRNKLTELYKEIMRMQV